MPDNTEYTNPNLTRQVAPPDMLTSKNKYSVFISGTNSYRAVEFTTDHDEQSDDDEIP